MPRYASLDDWIAREAVSFDDSSAASLAAAAGKMLAALGESVELLGLGEPMHGGEAFLAFRNRLFQQLATAHGFSAIAVESSFPRGRVIDDYVHGRGGDSYDAVQDAGFSHQFGKLDTSRELVEWMRACNSDPGRKTKLRFYGFDAPNEMMYADSPRHLLTRVLDYLATLAPAWAVTRRERIESLIGDDAVWENTTAAFDPSKGIGRTSVVSELRIETEDLVTELQLRRPEATDVGRFAEAMHDAVVVRQLLNYHAVMAKPTDDRLQEMCGIRDAAMGENLEYIANRERGRGKVLVFAHNHHLKTGQAEMRLGPHEIKWWPAGSQARARLGSRYAVIGTGVGTSAANGIGDPEPGTLEAVLTARPGPGQFIPTHGGRCFQPETLAALPTRSPGTKNPGYFPLAARSFTDFDALIVLDTTTYTRGQPPLPG